MHGESRDEKGRSCKMLKRERELSQRTYNLSERSCLCPDDQMVPCGLEDEGRFSNRDDCSERLDCDYGLRSCNLSLSNLTFNS